MTCIFDPPSASPDAMFTDDDCLFRWVRDRDSTAFAVLVRRHVDMVYAAALRQMAGDPAAADDVTQAVFIVLARRASAARRSRSLAGWLHTTTRYAAANARKLAARRRNHERRAAELRPEAAMPQTRDETIDPVLLVLDDAIASLGPIDRAAIVERYLNGRDISRVARQLGSSAEATQKRIERAVAKLRRRLAARGVERSPVVIFAALTAAAEPASAPAYLSLAVTTAAGTTPSAVVGNVIANGTLAMLSWTRIEAAALLMAVIMCAGGAATVAIARWTPPTLPPAQTIAAAPLAVPRPIVARIRGGPTVTLRGVSDPLMNRGTDRVPWWAADGTPAQAVHAPLLAIADEGRNIEAAVADAKAAGRVIEFAIALPGSVKAPAAIEIEPMGDQRLIGRDVAPDDISDQRGHSLAVVAGVPQDAESLTLRLCTEADEAVELAAATPAMTPVRASIDGGAIGIADFRDAAGGASLELSVSANVMETYALFVAVLDDAGKPLPRDLLPAMQGVEVEHIASAKQSAYQRRITFEGVKLAEVARVIVRGKPLRWAEFRDVSLAAGLATSPNAVVYDGPIVVPDQSTPRGALVAYLTAEDRGDLAVMRQTAHLRTDAGREMMEASIDWTLAKHTPADTVRHKLGDAGAKQVADGNADLLTQVRALPEQAIAIDGDHATLALDPTAPKTPMLRVDGRWRLDVEEYIRLCRSTPADEVKQARTAARRLNALNARIASGEIATPEALRKAYAEAVEF